MKRKFTKLMAALALLALLVPIGVWGQNDYSATYSSNCTLTAGTNGSTCTVKVNDIGYDGIKVGTSNKGGDMSVTVPAGAKYLHIHVAAWNGVNDLSLNISPDTNISPKSVDLTANSGISNSSPFTFSGAPTTSDYYKVITFANALTEQTTLTFTTSKAKRFVIWGVNSEDEGGTPPPAPTYALSSAVTPTGTGTVSLSKILLEPGETATAEATANAHYTFTSWSIAGEGATLTSTTTNPTTVTMGTANATITATFTEDPKYDITYNPNYEGSTDEPVVVSDYAGETMTIADYSTFSRTGYAITNWNAQADGNGTSYNAGDSYTMTSAGLTLYAQWEESTEVVDVLDLEFTGIAGGTGYGNWNGKEGASGAVYAGNSGGGSSSSNPSIQLRTSNSNSGIVSTTSGGKVTKVEVTWNSSTQSGRKLDIYGKNSAYSAATDLYGDNRGTLIGSITCGNNNLTVLPISGDYEYIGLRSNSGAIYLNEIQITWSTAQSTDPSITAGNVNITYDAEAGEIEYTVNNPVSGGVLTATTESDWLTIGSIGQTIPFTCGANPTSAERTATVTLTYTYNTTETVTKDVTITQAAAPIVYTSIPAIFAAATTTETNVLVTFNNWVVSGVSTNGKNIFVTDNNGNGFVIYYTSDMSGTFAAGNVLSGTAVSCTLKLYNGFAELLNVNATNLTITTGGTITTADIAMAELTGVNTGALVHYENLTCSVDNNKYYLSDGTTTLQVFNSLYAFEALENGKSYNVTGVYQQYNTTKEILPRSAADIEEVTSTVPSVTVTPTTVNFAATAPNGVQIENLTITYENIEVTNYQSFTVQRYDYQGNEIETNVYTWLVVGVTAGPNDEGYVVRCVAGNNDGAARTAYFKVYALDADNNKVYSELVTVTQAEYVAPTYAELPFAFNGGKAAIEETDGLYQEGLGSDYSSDPKLKFDGTGDWLLLQFQERPGTLTFKIKGNGYSSGSTSTFKVQTSADGISYTDLATYTELGDTDTKSFDALDENVRYIKWIYTEKGASSGGNVALGDIALAEYEEPQPSITLEDYNIEVPYSGGDGTMTVQYVNIEEVTADIQFYYYDGEELKDTDSEYYEDWFVAEIDDDNNVEYTVDPNLGAARSAYFKVYALVGEDFVYSGLITVTQDAAPEPFITVAPAEVNVDADEHDGTLDLTYESLTISSKDDFAIQYYDVTGEELNDDDKPDWIEVEVAEQDPQIGEGYVVSYIMFENESEEARTAYFKVFADGGDEDFVYSNLVTVTQAAPVVDYAVLPFEWEGGERSVFEALNGTSTHGVGDYTNAQQGVYKMKLDGTGDYIQVKTDSQPGKVTIGVKMVGGASTSTITVQGSADGETFTSIEALTISGAQNDELTLKTNNAFGANDRYVRMLFTKGSNVGVGPISIAKVSTDPYITLVPGGSPTTPESPYQMEFDYSAGGGQVDQVVYGNFDVDLTAASFKIQFCDAEGNAVDVIPDWIIGETPKVVLNTSENKLYLEVSVAMNTVADPRTAYFKVGASNDGPMVYSDVVTVNQTGYVPAIAVNPAEVAVPNEGGEGQLTVTYDPFTFSANPIYNVWWCDANGNSVVSDAYPWLSASFGETRNVLVWQVTTANESEEPRIAYLKVEAKDDYNTNMVYSNLVTITQAAQTVTYSLATEIVSGKHYIITSGTDGSVKAMGKQNNNNRPAVSVTATDGVIPETEGVYEVVIIGPDVEGYYTLYDVTNEKYLYAAGSSTTTNYLKTQDDINDRARWSITVNQDGTATIYAITTENISKYIRYNNNSTIFSCYASATNQNNIYLFAKDNEPTVSYEKEIASYGTSLNGGYYLIASPVGQVTPTESNEFLTNKYDLYAFDQSEEAEWRNYEAGSFNLISGRGYLYANNGDNVTLTFEGYPYVGNGQVMLAYDGDAEFAGWNLIGNPFGKKATLSLPHYSLNEEGSALNTSLEESDVDEMEGVFVKATATVNSATFTQVTRGNQAVAIAHTNIVLSNNKGSVLDNAIVRFDNGMTLDKFQLRENSTKVYFTEGNHDYAIVASEAQGEMPVNFKAESNGSYTIAVEPKNVEMTYLHLIDNMTGADIDLLQTPSYTFEARTSDYASRFRLVFDANSATKNATETFAFFNGSEWQISNVGEATLQVVDMMGRVLSTETICGNAGVNINQAAGIYMLRLVNGDDVKVQKVVVR